MFIDPAISWSSIYRRNNKTKNKKHLLCFPDHSEGKHKENGFCGQSINVYIYANELTAITPLVYGRFSLLGSQSDAHSVGDVIPIDSINTDMLSESPYYTAVEKGNLGDKIVFTINPRLKGWNYGRPLTHTEFLYSFYVYLFDRIDDNNLICKDRVASPPFRLCTSRRCSATPIHDRISTIINTHPMTNTIANIISSIQSPINHAKVKKMKYFNINNNNNNEIQKSPMVTPTNNNNNNNNNNISNQREMFLDNNQQQQLESNEMMNDNNYNNNINNELPLPSSLPSSSYSSSLLYSNNFNEELLPPPLNLTINTPPPPPSSSPLTIQLPYTPIQNNSSGNNSSNKTHNSFKYDDLEEEEEEEEEYNNNNNNNEKFMDMSSISDVINSFPPLSPCNSQTHLKSKTVTKNDPESPQATQVMELKGKKETLENLPGINSTTAFVKEEDGRAKEYFRFIQNIELSPDSKRTEIAPNGDDIERYLEYDITRPLYQLDRCGRIIPIEHLINYVFDDEQ